MTEKSVKTNKDVQPTKKVRWCTWGWVICASICFLFVLGAVLLPLRARSSRLQQMPTARPTSRRSIQLVRRPRRTLKMREDVFAAGDQRNALYARLGKLRSNIQQRDLPETSASSQES